MTIDERQRYAPGIELLGSGDLDRLLHAHHDRRDLPGQLHPCLCRHEGKHRHAHTAARCFSPSPDAKVWNPRGDARFQRPRGHVKPTIGVGSGLWDQQLSYLACDFNLEDLSGLRERGRSAWYSHYELRVAKVERAYGKKS